MKFKELFFVWLFIAVFVVEASMFNYARNIDIQMYLFVPFCAIICALVMCIMTTNAKSSE